MEPLDLDPDGYGGTYKLVGGESSLDFINTVSWPDREREHDWFGVVTNVTLWAEELGLIDEQTRRRLDRLFPHGSKRAVHQLKAIRNLRRTLRAVIAPLAHGDRPSLRSVEDFNALLARASRDRQVDPESLQWTWVAPKDLVQVFTPVIWNAADVVTSVDRRRLRYCPTCDWLFHDTTRNASRRWCDMTDCGSRDKALRYYHRHKANLS
ncbi:MAG: CGNR zinc finger domain-containing protein [Actinomycetota bacterium]